MDTSSIASRSSLSILISYLMVSSLVHRSVELEGRITQVAGSDGRLGSSYGMHPGGGGGVVSCQVVGGAMRSPI